MRPMRPSASPEEERPRMSGGFNGTERGSPPLAQRRSPFEHSPSLEASFALKKNVSRTMFKAKSRVLNELNIKEVPEVKKRLCITG